MEGRGDPGSQDPILDLPLALLERTLQGSFCNLTRASPGSQSQIIVTVKSGWCSVDWLTDLIVKTLVPISYLVLSIARGLAEDDDHRRVKNMSRLQKRRYTILFSIFKTTNLVIT